jgi:hypothetical protein
LVEEPVALSATAPPEAESVPLVFEVWVSGVRPVDGWPLPVVLVVGVVVVVGEVPVVVGTVPVLPVGAGAPVPVVGVLPIVGVEVVGTVPVVVGRVPVLPGVVVEGGLVPAVGLPARGLFRLSGSITSEMGSGCRGAAVVGWLLVPVLPEIVAPASRGRRGAAVDVAVVVAGGSMSGACEVVAAGALAVGRTWDSGDRGVARAGAALTT